MIHALFPPGDELFCDLGDFLWQRSRGQREYAHGCDLLALGVGWRYLFARECLLDIPERLGDEKPPNVADVARKVMVGPPVAAKKCRVLRRAALFAFSRLRGIRLSFHG